MITKDVKNMNIAICFCGLLKTYKYTVDNFYNNIIIPNSSCSIDIFFNTDHDNPEEIKNEIIKTYDLKTVTITAIKNIQINKTDKNITVGMKSFKEQFKKLEHTLNYIKKNELEYDLIVRTRPDLLIEKPIVFSKDADKVQAFIGYCHDGTILCTDVFFASNFENMLNITTLKNGFIYNYNHSIENPYIRKKSSGKEAECQVTACVLKHGKEFIPFKSGWHVLRNNNLNNITWSALDYNKKIPYIKEYVI